MPAKRDMYGDEVPTLCPVCGEPVEIDDVIDDEVADGDGTILWRNHYYHAWCTVCDWNEKYLIEFWEG